MHVLRTSQPTPQQTPAHRPWYVNSTYCTRRCKCLHSRKTHARWRKEATFQGFAHYWRCTPTWYARGDARKTPNLPTFSKDACKIGQKKIQGNLLPLRWAAFSTPAACTIVASNVEKANTDFLLAAQETWRPSLHTMGACGLG